MNKILQKFVTAFAFISVIAVIQGYAAMIENETGSITGRLISDSTSTPVSFASVALLNAADSSIVSGIITDDQGTFSFNEVPYGTYRLKITFIGYRPVDIRNIEVSRQRRNIDLKDMKMMEDVKTLDAAVIVGQRLKGEEKVDRTVFTLNDDIRKASTTSLDALKHIPSVSVDFQNNVSLEGQSNIQFYVDGVLRNKEYVAQIKPDMIDRIELITNPGVKYDADVSGVINIVLKKEARYGISGSIKVPIPHPTKIVSDGNGNLEYGNQRFRLYAGDQLHYEQFRGFEKTTTSIDDVNGSPYYFEKKGEGKNSWANNYMNYGIDWFLNEKSSLNFLGEWRSWNGRMRQFKNDTKIFTGNDLTEHMKSVKGSADGSDNLYFSLFYQRKLSKPGNEVKAEVYYNVQTGHVKNNFVDNYLDVDNPDAIIRSVDRLDVTENKRQNGEFKLDGTFMVGKLQNEIGLRTYSAWMDNSFRNTYTIEDIDNEIKDKFSYDETRQTAYYNISGKIKKFSWQAGLRGEYSSLNINKNTKADYAVLLPQFSLSQGLPKDQSLKLTYRKQIFRPSIGSLNPFEVWTDSMHVRTGNPNLDPSIENKFELGYTKNFKANYISPKVYLKYTTNGIQDNTTIREDGVTVLNQDNVGKSMEYGLAVNGAFQIMKRWRFNGNISVFEQIVKTDVTLAGHAQEDIVSYRFNFSNIVSLPKDYTVFMFANYGSPNISYQRKYSRDLLMLVGASKKFNDVFSADVFYNPFIRKFKYRAVETSAPGYHETWSGQVDVEQLFCFTVTYNFNRGNKISKINRAVEYERNEGKGGL